MVRARAICICCVRASFGKPRSVSPARGSCSALIARAQEDQQDYQLINSVYLDNSSMELYHGRLDKRPNAIATRIR